MLSKETIHYIRTVIAPQREPLLTLYLDINPAKQDNSRAAVLNRAKAELERLTTPKAFAQALIEKLKLSMGLPQGHTAVLFAGEDLETFFNYYVLNLDLPMLSKTGALARWGKPFVLPLLHLVDSQERYAVVFIDQERWRYFEVFFGEISELQDAIRTIDYAQWRELTESNVGVVQGVAARGGSGKDHFEHRKEDWTHRFYKTVHGLLKKAVAKNNARYLLLMGPEAYVQDFKRGLSPALAQMMVGTLPQPLNSNASAEEILELVKPSIKKHRADLERELSAKLKEQGIYGLEPCLEALQEGRLALITVFDQFDHTVYHCSETGYVATTLSGMANHCPNQEHSLLLLSEILPELVEKHAAKLSYVSKDAEGWQVEEWQGIAGLKRW